MLSKNTRFDLALFPMQKQINFMRGWQKNTVLELAGGRVIGQLKLKLNPEIPYIFHTQLKKRKKASPYGFPSRQLSSKLMMRQKTMLAIIVSLSRKKDVACFAGKAQGIYWLAIPLA